MTFVRKDPEIHLVEDVLCSSVSKDPGIQFVEDVLYNSVSKEPGIHTVLRMSCAVVSVRTQGSTLC